jgi:hypothetical protein
MPFRDTKEGTTHHDNDSCIKCIECDGHYSHKSELHQHLAESVQCSDMDIIEFKEKADNNDLTNI